METVSAAKDWLKKIESERAFFIKGANQSLETINKALEKLERPDLLPKWRVIVGGSAGKGSTVKHVEDGLLLKNKTVVTLTSPHIESANERIKINGKVIGDERLAAVVLEIKKLCEKESIALTYYEVFVLAGILVAQKEHAEYVIAEIGLGGRLDAVNAIKGPRVAAVTSIGSDHWQVLGGSYESIAKEKAAIMNEETKYALTGANREIKTIKTEAKVPVEVVKGIEKKKNKKMARKILKYLLPQEDFELPKLKLPARWEKWEYKSVKVVLDGAHSPERFAYIWPKVQKWKKFGLIVGKTKRHSAQGLEKIIQKAENVYYCPIADKECENVDDLIQKFEKGTGYKSAGKALEAAVKENETLLVTGSLYLCGEIRKRMRQSDAKEK